jgi:hypothetical protein
MDGQLFYTLTMLQVFAVQGFAAGFKRGGDDQAVVKTELVGGLYVETTLVKHPAGVDLPQREQHLVEKLHGILGGNGNSELFGYDIECFLYNRVHYYSAWLPVITDLIILLNSAEKMSANLQQIIRKRPQLFADLIRQLKSMPNHAILCIARDVCDGDW